MLMIPQGEELQAKIHRNVPSRYPWVARAFGHSPLLNLRATTRVEHDVHISVSCRSIAHGCQGEKRRIRLLKRLDLRRLIQEPCRAVPGAQDQRGAIRNSKKYKVGQGCTFRALWQFISRIERLIVLGNDCERGSWLNS
jgi:hypothetical protein